MSKCLNITNQVIKEFVARLSLSPKTVDNIVQAVRQVKASAINEDGEEILPSEVKS